MRILFDLLVLNNGKKKYTLDEEKMFETIHNFIYDKTFTLLEETDAVEEKNDTACIMAEILNQRISFNGYSKELEDKLKECFDENATKELQERFKEAFAYLN